MLTGPKDHSIFNVLSSAPYKSVMENNVDLDLSFDSVDNSIEKTLAEPKQVFFHYERYVELNPKYKCKVLKYIRLQKPTASWKFFQFLS